MKSVKRIFLICISGFCFACSPRLVEKITWLEPDVDTSGFPSHYKGSRQQYSSVVQVVYVLSNDSNNLYLCLRIPEEKTQMQIMMAGMSIFLDSGKKAFHDRGIAFPIANEFRNTKPQPGLAEQNDKTTRRKEFLLQQNTLELWGFNQSVSGRIPRSDSSKIKVNLHWDSMDVMIYEAVIPLEEFFQPLYGLIDTTAVFNFGITINELKLPNRPQGGGMGAGGRPGGGMPGGGMPGGGPPSGGMPGGGPGRVPGSDMTQQKSFQYLFRLSLKDEE